jgi:hypothetical protein
VITANLRSERIMLIEIDGADVMPNTLYQEVGESRWHARGIERPPCPADQGVRDVGEMVTLLVRDGQPILGSGE